MKISIPVGATMIIDRLYENGFHAYVVGGCIRDALMNKEPDDWDITTDALPEQVKMVFKDAKVIETGISHGTVTVILNGEHYEVTTYRVDGKYTDHRHPDTVDFSRRLEDDLARRDFTINAIAYNYRDGLIDPYNGSNDINAKVIRAVGKAEKRFEEDGLRILRGLRFASRLGFEIDEETSRAMKECMNYLNFVAGERKYTEICKLLLGKNVLDVLLGYPDIIATAIPEIKKSINFDQCNHHHIYDVWEHTAHSVAEAPCDKITRLAMLLHDSGKPYCMSVDTNGTGHFYGHAKHSVELARSFFSRSGEATEIRQRVSRLIEYHDSTVMNDEKIIKRWLGKLGEDDLLRLIDVKIADCMAQAPQYHNRLNELTCLADKIREVISQKPCFLRGHLAINGKDLIGLGINGVQIGVVLDKLLNAVIEEKCRNDRKELLELAISFIDMQ